mmetsp:Transcript_31352/g.55115  ORF Transcript_31352/g.55115 Transcript_31352/m.55115 type:complete len:215 (-) Transcript_31352:164-808(-)
MNTAGSMCVLSVALVVAYDDPSSMALTSSIHRGAESIGGFAVSNSSLLSATTASLPRISPSSTALRIAVHLLNCFDSLELRTGAHLIDLVPPPLSTVGSTSDRIAPSPVDADAAALSLLLPLPCTALSFRRPLNPERSEAKLPLEGPPACARAVAASSSSRQAQLQERNTRSPPQPARCQEPQGFRAFPLRNEFILVWRCGGSRVWGGVLGGWD